MFRSALLIVVIVLLPTVSLQAQSVNASAGLSAEHKQTHDAFLSLPVSDPDWALIIASEKECLAAPTKKQRRRSAGTTATLRDKKLRDLRRTRAMCCIGVSPGPFTVSALETAGRLFRGYSLAYALDRPNLVDRSTRYVDWGCCSGPHLRFGFCSSLLSTSREQRSTKRPSPC